MKSFQELYTLCQSISNNQSTATLNLFKQLINDTDRHMVSGPVSPYVLENIHTTTTVASQQSYFIPTKIYKLNDVTVTVGSYTYRPREITNRKDWDSVNMTTYTSDIPNWYYVYDDKVYFYPTPASNGNTITFNGMRRFKNMTAADYTTGTVTTLAANGTAVTGSGTTWTSAMIGRYIKIDSDGFWYEITAVGSTTTLTIKKAYQGTAIAAGSETYTIGEMPVTPEAYQDALAWRPLWIYFTQQKDDRAPVYKAMFDEIEAQMKEDYGSKTTDVGLDVMDMLKVENPNAYPRSIG